MVYTASRRQIQRYEDDVGREMSPPFLEPAEVMSLIT